MIIFGFDFPQSREILAVYLFDHIIVWADREIAWSAQLLSSTASVLRLHKGGDPGGPFLSFIVKLGFCMPTWLKLLSVSMSMVAEILTLYPLRDTNGAPSRDVQLR